MGFLGNLARVTQVLIAAGVDPGQSDDSLESIATVHDAHVSGLRHLAGTPDRKSGSAYWQSLLFLSQRSCQAHLPITPFSCAKFPSTKSCGAFCWCLFHLRCCLMSLFSVRFVKLVLEFVQHFNQFCQHIHVHCTPNMKPGGPNRSRNY